MVTYACMRRNWGFDCFWFLRRTEKYKKNEPYKKYYFYWNACTKPGKCVVMYLCVKGIPEEIKNNQNLSFSSYRHKWPLPILAILFSPFGFIAPKYSSIYTIILWCPCYMPTYVPRVEGIMRDSSLLLLKLNISWI
jgi:hypothetical protein